MVLLFACGRPETERFSVPHLHVCFLGLYSNSVNTESDVVWNSNFTLICLWFSVNTPQKQPQKSLGSNGHGQSNTTLTQVLMAGFGKAQEGKQFMEEVLQQIFSLKGSWTLSVSSLRIGCHLEITSQNLLGLEGTFGDHPVELSCSKQGVN